MASPSLHNAHFRAVVYKKLARRNAVMAVLRIAVPVCGFLLLLFLVAQIFIANIADQYGVSGIGIERDALVIETPTYEGTMANGTTYRLAAEKATAPLSATNILDLSNVVLDLKRNDGIALHATTALAQYDLLEQTVVISGETRVRDSRQINAVLRQSVVDWETQKFSAMNGVKILFSDGTVLEGDTLIFDGKDTEWHFTNARLVTGHEHGPDQSDDARKDSSQ